MPSVAMLLAKVHQSLDRVRKRDLPQIIFLVRWHVEAFRAPFPAKTAAKTVVELTTYQLEVPGSQTWDEITEIIPHPLKWGCIPVRPTFPRLRLAECGEGRDLRSCQLRHRRAQTRFSLAGGR